jgi:hypothetical protein
MFDNLFAHFGPIWSASALFGIVLVLFVVAAVQTVRLALESSGARRLALELLELRRGLERAWAAGPASFIHAPRSRRRR